MSRTQYLCIALTLLALGLVPMGCSKANPQPPPPAEQPSGGEQQYTARTKDGVDVLYFEEGNPCECMADFGVVIKDAVQVRFANELRNGSLRFFVIVSDDFDNQEVLDTFGSPLYDLVIVEHENGHFTATTVRDIWSVMGDDEALASCVEVHVRDALARHGAS